MADFTPAVYYVMENEGGYVHQEEDSGGATNFGITLNFLKSLGKKGDINNDGTVNNKDIKSLTSKKASNFYYEYWWKKYSYNQISSQVIATKIFDMSVNMGACGAHKLAERCVKKLYVMKDSKAILPIVEECDFKLTLIDKVNEINENDMVQCLSQESLNHYKSIVKKHPNNKVFIKGWTKRALKIPSGERAEN